MLIIIHKLLENYANHSLLNILAGLFFYKKFKWEIFLALLIVSSSPVPSLLAAWSPWEPSPLFHQQRLSLISSQVPSFLQRSTNSISNARTTSQPIHQPLTTRQKSENASSSSHSEKSPSKTKSKTHNSVKNLIEPPLIEKNDFKYLSNSLNCLDATKL